MVERKYVEFIDKIIKLTKAQKTNWYYLDGNKDLYTNMGWCEEKADLWAIQLDKKITVPDFNVEDSFYTKVNDTYVVVYVWRNQPAKLYIVPNTYKKVLALMPDEYGEYITRLFNLVQSLFPSSEKFIDDFLSQEIL